MYSVETALCLLCGKLHNEYDIEHQENDSCPHCGNDDLSLIIDVQTEE